MDEKKRKVIEFCSSVGGMHPISRMLFEIQRFIERCERIPGIDPEKFWEPEMDESHLWSQLTGLLEDAENVREEIILG